MAPFNNEPKSASFKLNLPPPGSEVHMLLCCPSLQGVVPITARWRLDHQLSVDKSPQINLGSSMLTSQHSTHPFARQQLHQLLGVGKSRQSNLRMAVIRSAHQCWQDDSHTWACQTLRWAGLPLPDHTSPIITAIGNQAVTCDGKQQLVKPWLLWKGYQVLALLGSPEGLRVKVEPNWGARGSHGKKGCLPHFA